MRRRREEKAFSSVSVRLEFGRFGRFEAEKQFSHVSVPDFLPLLIVLILYVFIKYVSDEFFL